MPEIINVGAAAPYLVALVLGILAYLRIKPADIGSAALASTEAAEKAIKIQDDVITDLEARVSRLEELVAKKDEKILRLENEIALLERWIAVLLEQMSQAGIAPVTLDKIRYLDNGINRAD